MSRVWRTLFVLSMLDTEMHGSDHLHRARVQGSAGSGNSDSHGARLVHIMITMIVNSYQQVANKELSFRIQGAGLRVQGALFVLSMLDTEMHGSGHLVKDVQGQG